MKFVPAKNYSKADRKSVELVVIHTAECGESAQAAENVAGFFAGAQAPQASAHYTVDADSITQSVLEKDIAWHAGPVNGFSIGIEHAGYAKQTAEEWDDVYSVEMLARSAELVADICARYGIPVVRLTAEDLKAGKRKGITGHVDVTNGLQGGKGHWDPGPNFPWSEYLDMVRSHLPTTELPAQVAMLHGFVEVEHDGVTWMVCAVYAGPIAIGEARTVAESLGCELPSPGLVDAIWRAADLKLDASKLTRQHDGTPATMNSAETHADQAKRIAALVGDRNLGVDFHLLAGAFKDVVMKDGKIGLYGWHKADGSVIQPFYAGHSPAWKDYSQGLRLVRRA